MTEIGQIERCSVLLLIGVLQGVSPADFQSVMLVRVVLLVCLSAVCWSLDLDKVSDAIQDCCSEQGVPDNVANQIEAIVQSKVHEATGECDVVQFRG